MIKILLLFALLLSTNLFAHSGRTNINGCHIDHTTNIEHCHGSHEIPVKNDNAQTIESNAIPFQKNNYESKIQSDNEQKSSSSTSSSALSALYFFLVIMLIVAFGEVLKTATELFKIINEKLKSKTKFAVTFSIFLTAITLTLVFLLIRQIAI